MPVKTTGTRKAANLTKEQALEKLKHFCAYQERCHSEVKEKLYELGVRQIEHDELIAALIEDGRLNEERFAIAFARGRFRIKRWGRLKIKYDLKQKGVSDYCIQKALKQIDDKEYLRVLKKLVEQKYTSLKNKQHLVRKKQTMDFVVRKGFEVGLVRDIMDGLKVK
jgi:regulatory protein